MAQNIRVVNWSNNANEGGFVSSETGPDVFVHFSTVQPSESKSTKGAGAVGYGTVTGKADRLNSKELAGTKQISNT